MIRIPKWMSVLFDNAFNLNISTFEVAHTHWITSGIRSIIFHGDLRALDLSIGRSVSIKLGPRSVKVFTPAFVDYEEQIFQVITHIKTGDPDYYLFEQIQTRQQLAVSMTRSQLQLNPASHYFLLGDQSALGLACRLDAHFRSLSKGFHALLHLQEAHRNLPELLGLLNYELVERSEVDSFGYLPPFSIFQTTQNNLLQDAQFILAGSDLDIQAFRGQLAVLGVAAQNIVMVPYCQAKKLGIRKN